MTDKHANIILSSIIGVSLAILAVLAVLVVKKENAVNPAVSSTTYADNSVATISTSSYTASTVTTSSASSHKAADISSDSNSIAEPEIAENKEILFNENIGTETHEYSEPITSDDNVVYDNHDADTADTANNTTTNEYQTIPEQTEPVPQQSTYKPENNFNTYDNPDQQNTTANFVLNTNTNKFHYPGCNDVKKIAPQNYSTSNTPRDELISQGYSPCGHCNP